MKAKFSVKTVRDNTASLLRSVRALVEDDVYIGIPEAETGRKELKSHGPTNAYLGYIHEFGAPEANIPARPHLYPGLQDIMPEAVELLREAAIGALEGDGNAVTSSLTKIGLLGEAAVKARFVNNDWPALAASTLAARQRQGKEGNINPLIDTGQLRKSITHVIRKRQQGGRIVQ